MVMVKRIWRLQVWFEDRLVLDATVESFGKWNPATSMVVDGALILTDANERSYVFAAGTWTKSECFCVGGADDV